MEYPPVASLRARRVFCPKPPCVGIAGGADRARRRSTRRKSSLGRGRRNKRPYLGRDHRGYVRGSDQLGDGGGRRGARGPARVNAATTTAANGLKTFTVNLTFAAGGTSNFAASVARADKTHQWAHVAHGRTRMTVFPARRSFALKVATASSRAETLPMFVR